MSSVRVVVVQVEGSVEHVVQVCEQLRLSLAPTPEMAAVAPTAQAQDKWGPPAQPSYAPPRPQSATDAAPTASRPVGPGSVRDQRRAAMEGADGVRDVVLPPHESMVRRPKHQLFEDLAAAIPHVGDTVRVNDFVRDEAEKQTLKAGIDKFGGDARFRWLRGMAGGARPARIRREKL